MKTQFDTLVKWQDAVIDVHKQHKTKFDETKQLISDVSTSFKLLNILISFHRHPKSIQLYRII